MSLERAKKHWKKYGLEDKIIEFDTSSATVEEAAKALGCSPGEIAKTLSFLVEGKPVLIVVAGDVKIDNSKYKAFFHQKAKMIPVDDVEKMIGHKVGGVCPFCILEGVEVYLDGPEELQRLMNAEMVTQYLDTRSEDEIDAINYAVCSGVKGIFTAHGSTLEEICINPTLKTLLNIHIFEKIIFLKDTERKSEVDKVYTLNKKTSEYIVME